MNDGRPQQEPQREPAQNDPRIDTKRRAMRTATARSLTVTGATIVLASPFYFAGFMLREEHRLIVGFGIVMLAKAAAGPPAVTQDHAADPAPSG